MQEARRFNIWMVVMGILLAVIGVLCISMRTGALSTLTLLVGLGFIFTAVLDSIVYVRYRSVVDFPGWMLVEGVLDLIIGLMFTLAPVFFANVIPLAIGIMIVIAGAAQLVLAFPARSVLPGWGGFIVFGIVTIIFGSLMIAYPGILAVFIGIYALFRGLSMVLSGATFGTLLGGR